MITTKWINANQDPNNLCNEPIEVVLCKKKDKTPAGIFEDSSIIETRVRNLTVNKLKMKIYYGEVNAANFEADRVAMVAGKESLEAAINCFVPEGEKADRLSDLNQIYSNMQMGFKLWNDPEMTNEEAGQILDAIDAQLGMNTKACSFTPPA